MKRIVLLIALAASLGAAAQQEIDLGVIPTPQKVERLTGSRYEKQICTLQNAKVVEQRVDSLPVEANIDQAYQLVVEPKRITIRYVGEAGRQNAHLTLEQMKRLHPWVKCLTITDWPAYTWRGWMDDQSRGPVPHEAYRQRQWQVLHALKYNFCNYYTEHTLYQGEFPDLAPAYANSQRNPDEVINLQLFAHAEKTLRIPFYQNMMDSRANFNPDAEATYDFLRKRVREAWHQMPFSPFFIIDCDETEQLGTGRARALVDSLGSDEVYVRHINRCYDLVQQEAPMIKRPAGSTPTRPRVVMWGDIVAKNPRMMKSLPSDMTYIMWAYEPLDSYAHLIRPFKENGTPFWVAPSLSHSSNMLPVPQHYMKNIANLARDGYGAGAEGLMNTCWDDNGEALFDNCWHGLFWSAEMAWNPLKTDDPEEMRQREEQFNRNFERLFYGDEGNKVAELYAVGALAYNPAVGDWYTSAALMEPLLGFNPANTGSDADQRIHEVFELWQSVKVDSVANPHAHYAMQRIRLTAYKAFLRRMIHFSLTHDSATVAREPNMRNMGGTLDAYLGMLFDLKREYLRLWDQENGDYERYIVMNRYDALAREVIDLDRHVFVQVESVDSLGGDINVLHSPLPTLHSPLCTLRTLYNDRPIYYTLDGSEPDSTSTLYEGPFPLERSATIKAISYNQYGEGVVTEQYLLSHLGMGARIKLNTNYSTYKPIYSGGGPEAIIDGQLGSKDTYADGHWQGYWGDSIDVVIELPTTNCQMPTNISMRFMQNTFDWILAPTQIRVYSSADGEHWTLVADKHFSMDPRETGMRLKNYVVDISSPLSTLHSPFLRVVVPNPGPLPQWHPAPGQPSYLFTDEIIIR